MMISLELSAPLAEVGHDGSSQLLVATSAAAASIAIAIANSSSSGTSGDSSGTSGGATSSGSGTSGPDPAFAQFRDQTRFWIQRVAVPMLLVIGVFGNLITVVIMTRRRMRSTTNMYLAALALVDMFYLVLTFLLGLSHYPNMAQPHYQLYWQLRPFLMMLTDACSNTSVWLTVTFTIERYIAVKYPIKGKVWCTEARARLLITCVFVFGILFAAPVPFEWEVIRKKVSSNFNTSAYPTPPYPAIINDRDRDNVPTEFQIDIVDGHGRTATTSGEDQDSFRIHANGDRSSFDYVLALDYSDFGRNETYKTIYYWSTAVIFYFIPLLSLTMFNGYLIKSVHQSRRERNKMISGRGQIASAYLRTSDHLGQNERELKEFPAGEATELTNTTSVSLSTTMNNPTQKVASASKVGGNNLGLIKREDVAKQTGCNTLEATSKECHRKDRNGALKGEDSSVICRPNRKRQTTRSSESQVVYKHNNIEANNEIGDNNRLMGRSSLSHPTKLSANTNGDNKLSSWRSTSAARAKQSNQPQSGKLATGACKQKLDLIGSASRGPSNYSSSPASSQERRITIMLIAVVILFLLCQIPSAAMLLYTSVRELEPNTNEHALVLAFGNIFNFLMAVNAAGNFILYSFLSKKYRKTFVILFCYCLRPAANSWANQTQAGLTSVRRTANSLYQLDRRTSDRRDTPV